MSWIVWVIVALILGMAEMLTVDFTFLMLAGGALAAAASAVATDSFTVQVIVFSIVSVILFFTVRPWARRHVAQSSPETRTNASALVGLDARTMTEVNPDGGRVRLDGQVWSARSTSQIPEDTVVRVVRIEGAHALVEPKE